jgi:hypothetical protein
MVKKSVKVNKPMQQDAEILMHFQIERNGYMSSETVFIS